MKKLLALLIAPFAAGFALALPYLTESTDKPAIDYRIGEPIVFTFSVNDVAAETPELFVRWSRSGDDGVFRTNVESVTEKKPLKVITTIDRPGFVYLKAELVDLSGKKYGRTLNLGAGADIENILPSYEEPADFDEYWRGELAKLAEVPVEATRSPVADSAHPKDAPEGFNVYNVSVKCYGARPVTGRLAIPKNAAEKSLPVQVNFDGYGPGAKNAPYPAWICQKEKIVFAINAHGYELDREDKYYADFFEKIPNYALVNSENVDRDKAYFHDMVMRVVRAFDYVKTLPEWNGKELIAAGGSQGGLQSSWAGALVKDLTLCKPNVTWCCDFCGPDIGRLGGWRPTFQKGLAYYDAVFHTRRIPTTCKLEITRIGLGDYVCPPSGVTAQYNVANCEKSAAWYQNSTHMDVPQPPEIFRREALAGAGKKNNAQNLRAAKRKTVNFVNAHFKPEAWTFATKGNAPEAINFGGRENLRVKRAPGGGDLKVMSDVELNGILVAEESGFALVGVGADWWWQLFANDKAVYGRTLGTPGANAKDSFKNDDWIFRVPVERGENQIRLEIRLGEHGVVAIDTLDPATFAELEISQKTFDEYKFFSEKYPEPEALPALEWKGRNGARICKFKTKQANPAGIEWHEVGEYKWQAVWNGKSTREHKISLPFEDGKSYEFRVIQHAFLGDAWQIIRSEPQKSL